MLVALIVSVVSGFFCIPLLRKLRAGQTVLKYVETHKEKNGTPTCGGLFFILSAVIVFLIFNSNYGRMTIFSISIGIAFMLVGFIDDFIKIRFKKNEGLKPYQKILFLLAISLLAGIFAYNNGITVFYLPFIKSSVNLGVFTIPIIVIIFIAITNSVNLTDGLDGLSGSVSAVYLLFIAILILVEKSTFNYMYLIPEEYDQMINLCFCLIGAILGFLVFNVNKAKVFMGDTGSLALGGFIGAISIFSSNSLFIPIIGICFVVSTLSVIIQVAYYKKTKKRVFLMAPLHHHFQMKGYSETQISFVYSIVTGILGVLSIIFYL